MVVFLQLRTMQPTKTAHYPKLEYTKAVTFQTVFDAKTSGGIGSYLTRPRRSYFRPSEEMSSVDKSDTGEFDPTARFYGSNSIRYSLILQIRPPNS